MTYRSYLRLGTLLDIQEPLGPRPATAELLFIVDHQAHELWFKVLLDTLEGIRAALLAGDAAAAGRLFQRVYAVQRLLVEQVEILETMSPTEFRRFRGSLGSASGMQSAQYHELEFLSGAKDPAYPREAPWLSAAAGGGGGGGGPPPTLWDAYVTLLGARGLSVGCLSVGAEPEIRATLATVAAGRADDAGLAELWALAEDLLSYDRLALEWRRRHLELVERQIGTDPGTGGTPGATYLRAHLDHRFYPLLWDTPASPNPPERSGDAGVAQQAPSSFQAPEAPPGTSL
jgi:tryptophan 2,3-dioxygenase